MDRGIIPLLLAGYFCAIPGNAWAKDSKALFDLWGKLSQPMPGAAEPIGSYSAGCLLGAEKLELDGPGYSVMRPSRLRFFGHPDLVHFLQELGRKREAAHESRLLVGDMGRPRGGPMASGHASHQIGLDVDLWYDGSRTKPGEHERESRSASVFVKGERRLSKAWKKQNRIVVSQAAGMEGVDRIFVHPAIKRDLCAHFKGAAWLYKVRAWWGHKDHFHVRLACPKGSATCKAQEALDPKNPQCGKELAWWFTKEAQDEWKKKQAIYAEREFPDLPGECGQMVSGLTAANNGVPGAQSNNGVPGAQSK